jgi:hypothetical protein
MTISSDLSKPTVGSERACDYEQLGSRAEFACFEVQRNGALLVIGDQAALTDYIKPMGVPIKAHERGVVLRKADADKRRYIPVQVVLLASGARLEYFESNGVGVKGDFRGGYMGIAENLAKLELFFTEDYGPVEFERVFGKPPEAIATQRYVEAQETIAERKAQNHANDVAKRLAYARATGDLNRLTQDEQAVINQEKEAGWALWNAELSKNWMESVGSGVVSNPLYQAFLDSVEDVEALALARSNGPYFSWHSDRCREFELANRGSPARDTQASREAFLIFCREWATQNLSERVRKKGE